MKRINLFLITVIAFTIPSNAQVYINNRGNVSKENQEQNNSYRPVQNNDYQTQPSYSQSHRSGFDKSKLVFGGGLGMGFSSDRTTINIAPQVGYSFNKYFTLGAGVGYTYEKDKAWASSGNRYDLKSHYANFNIYGRFYPIKFIVISAQPEANYMWRTVKPKGFRGESFKKNKFVPSVLVGGGVRFGPMTAMIQYDVVQDDYTPYSDKIFYTVGFTFGL